MRIVAASVDPPAELRTMRESSGASFPFLSDPDGRLLDLMDARHVEGRYDGADIARASNFLLKPDGEVLWIHRSQNYRERLKPDVLLKLLDERVDPATQP